MKKIPRISDSEWEVMQVVWARHPITAAEIIRQLGWHPKTARTLIARLVQKKALRASGQGRTYAYEPLVSETECKTAVSRSFLDRVFGGSMKPMLAHFVEQQQLTKKELEELRRELEKGGR